MSASVGRPERGFSGMPGSANDPLQTSRDQRYSVQEAIRKMIVGASLYEPINVFKPIGPDIGIVDGPFEYLTVNGVRLPLPFTTRMTVVRLSNGDLFLQSPIKFDEVLASELQRMGTIRHLVSPNQFHYAHIGEWSKAFPDAIPWASPRVRQKARARHIDVTFARDLDFNPPEEWRQDIDQTLFPGGYFKEFIFFHKKSKTLFSRTRLSTSSWIRCPSLGERRQSSAGCTILAGKYSSACGRRSYCSSERLKQHSQKSTLGDRSALCSAMAGVSSLVATKSSGGYLERRRLESKTRSAASRANFPSGPNRSAAVSRLTQMCYPFGRRRRPPYIDSGPPRLGQGDPMKR